MQQLTMALSVAVMALVATACGGGNQQEPQTEGAPAGSQEVQMTFSTEPDPPITGENTFEAMVMQGGQPVTDADVSVMLFMAAMPSMNMPEMKNSVPLKHEGGGRYRGTGNVMMSGASEVTVTATRGGQEIATRTFGVSAK